MTAVRVAVVIAAAALLAGCTSSTGPAPSTPASTATTTLSPSPPPTAPVSTGPTRAVRAASCPFIQTSFVRDTLGMRLGRLTVLRSGGRTAGCRFYALQGGPLHSSEHLPGPDQPAAEITTVRYPSAGAAHNAFVRAAELGRDAQRAQLGDRLGVCYQTDFYPRDGGRDWACSTNVGAIAVLVQTVDTTGTFSTSALAAEVLRHV